jgi:type I restriction enzyme M protein
MRRKMIEEDLVECVIGLGPNLFYNSPMEACLLITKTNKEKSKKGKILFINAVNEVKQESNMGYLQASHIDKIFNAYQKFKSIENFSILVDRQEVLDKSANMAINLYVRQSSLIDNETISFDQAYQQWDQSSDELKVSMSNLFKVLSA